jgi:hypothetical protein
MPNYILKETIRAMTLCFGNNKDFWKFDPLFYIRSYLTHRRNEFNDLLYSARQLPKVLRTH